MLTRILKFAWTDFSRNRGANIAAVFVLVITISLATGLYLFQGLTGFLIAQVQEKIDVAAYFKEDVQEEDILKVKSELANLSSEVQDVQYVSKEEALFKFIERHRDNLVLINSLEEVGQNPFLASLNIRVAVPAQYENVSNFLGGGQFSNLIEKVDYYQKKPTIEKIFSVTSGIERWGWALSLILVLIAIAVVFNTIKLAIADSKEEISTMRLVGASNWFIKGPFLVQGAISGFFAFVICFLIFLTSTFFLAPKLEFLAPGFNIFNYFVKNLLVIILIQLAFGVGLGVVSGFFVVRKYLKA